MKFIHQREFLRDPDVVNEINKFKWLQSEKSGFDIGFEKAARDWIQAHSSEYLKHHPGKATSMLITNFFNSEIHITVK